MSNNTYYIERHPGDLVTAEDWNDLQAKIQADMKKEIDDAKNDVTKKGVSRADNADKFDNKSAKNWTDDLDQRYAPKVHDHEGLANYRRYFRKLDPDETFVLLEHGLGRMPLVDVYQLLPIEVTLAAPAPPTNTKFLLYYGHEELDLLQGVVTGKRVPRRGLGTSWERFLQEFKVKYEDDDSLRDVINDFLEAFFNLPIASEMDHQQSDRIKDYVNRDRTVADLKKRDEWDDIRWLFLPQQLDIGGPPPNGGGRPRVDVIHLSYDTLMVKVDPAPLNGLDCMLILRS